MGPLARIRQAPRRALLRRAAGGPAPPRGGGFCLGGGLLHGLALILTMVTPVGAADPPQGSFLLATTTSTENTGLLDYLNPAFERATGIHVRVLARGTGAALRAGEDGNCDALLVHDRRRELRFVNEGFGTHHHAVMHNDFVLVGPPEDPAGVAGMKDAAAALKQIAAAGSRFVSRGDDSGTHARELELWRSAGFTFGEAGVPVAPLQDSSLARAVVPPSEPARRWYLSVGQGMAKTLTIAYEKRAYTLSDRGTYLSQRGRTDLEILVEGDTRLYNPYGIMAVNPARHPHVKYELACRYIDWIISPEAQRLIAQFTIDGEPLFFPDAHPEFAPAAGDSLPSPGEAGLTHER